MRRSRELSPVDAGVYPFAQRSNVSMTLAVNRSNQVGQPLEVSLHVSLSVSDIQPRGPEIVTCQPL